MIRFFHTFPGKTRAHSRIGPHSKQVLSVLVGNLLGAGSAEKRHGSTRFQIYMEAHQMEYVCWLHKIFSKAGYCNPKRPQIHRRIGKGNRIRYGIRFKLYSFSSLNWLYDAFYVDNVKRIPPQIGEWLDAQALAIWLMDDGGGVGSGVCLATHCFSFQDQQLLQKTLLDNFNLITSLHREKNHWKIYIPKNQRESLIHWVKPFLLPSMFSKIPGLNQQVNYSVMKNVSPHAIYTEK